MPVTNKASMTISEMREFASFTAAEQRYIRRSLDIGLGRCDAFLVWGRNASENAAIRRLISCFLLFHRATQCSKM